MLISIRNISPQCRSKAEICSHTFQRALRKIAGAYLLNDTRLDWKRILVKEEYQIMCGVGAVEGSLSMVRDLCAMKRT